MPTTSAVQPLRTATAVATSKPLLNANRADTWLAAISKATSNKLAKPCRLSALALLMPYKPAGKGQVSGESGAHGERDKTQIGYDGRLPKMKLNT
jgi:hypothetical protein